MSQTLTIISNNVIPLPSLKLRSLACSFKLSNNTSLHCSLPNSSQNVSIDAQIAPSTVPRRNLIALGIASSTLLGLNIGEKNAWAASRRPPPPPTEEKKDPNISGVQAKVLASKKRKEAMKQAMAEQRERGKKIIEQPKSSSPPPPPPSEPPS